MQNSVPSAVLPAEGYVIEIGGQFNSAYRTFTAALQAGLELKHQDSQAQVKVYDAGERAVGAGEQS